MATHSDALLARLMAARNGASKPVQRDWTTLVFVSLYLVLLAFFLGLNAASTKEGDKVRKAMESIDARFRGPFYEESGVIDVKERPGVLRTSNDALDDIGVLLRGIALTPGLKTQADGDTLKVSVLTHKLFPPRGSALRDNQSGLFDNVEAFRICNAQQCYDPKGFIFTKTMVGHDANTQLFRTSVPFKTIEQNPASALGLHAL